MFLIHIMVWILIGALAQLGERNTGSVEVSGSIPLGSTNSSNHRQLDIVAKHRSQGKSFYTLPIFDRSIYEIIP